MNADARQPANEEKVICDQPCHYGGLSMARKYSKSDLGKIWHCNRRVKHSGDKCWQHRSE